MPAMTGTRQDAFLPAMVSPEQAWTALCDAIEPVDTETVETEHALGRVLAESLHADRDSPALDVSAMDGYAVGSVLLDHDLPQDHPVAFETRAGDLPGKLEPGEVAKILTGAAIPAGASAVVRREDVVEHKTHIQIQNNRDLKPGANIRRQGENTQAGQEVLAPGQAITPNSLVAAAAFGYHRLLVRRPVRVGVLISGNEVVVASGANPSMSSAELRDSNGPMVSAMLQACRWAELIDLRHAADDLDQTRVALEDLSSRSDVLITTGGVSMGDYDMIPAAIVNLNAKVIYHHLAMRPGKPNLGAVLPNGVPVIALPGNPMSVWAGMSVLVSPVLRRLAGLEPAPRCPRVAVAPESVNSPFKAIPLWRYLPAVMDAQGKASLIPNRGSGDIAALAQAEGCVELAPGLGSDELLQDLRHWREGRLR